MTFCLLQQRWRYSSDTLRSSLMKTTKTGTMEDVVRTGRAETGGGGTLHPATLPETRRGSFQSAMKWTNVTGKAPLLIGSPSMWPNWREGRQEGRQRIIKASEEDSQHFKTCSQVTSTGGGKLWLWKLEHMTAFNNKKGHVGHINIRAVPNRLKLLS